MMFFFYRHVQYQTSFLFTIKVLCILKQLIHVLSSNSHHHAAPDTLDIFPFVANLDFCPCRTALSIGIRHAIFLLVTLKLRSLLLPWRRKLTSLFFSDSQKCFWARFSFNYFWNWSISMKLSPL